MGDSRSTQGAVQHEVEEMAQRKGLRLTTDHAYSNVGTWRFYPPGSWEPVLTIGFDFQGVELDVFPRVVAGSNVKVEPYPWAYDYDHPNVVPRRRRPAWATGKSGPAYIGAFIDALSEWTDVWYDRFYEDPDSPEPPYGRNAQITGQKGR